MLLLAALALALRDPWSEQQAGLAAVITSRIGMYNQEYFCCKAPRSVQTHCPTVKQQLGMELLNVAIPSEARWLFGGPSYMREIYLAFLLANGPCVHSAVTQLAHSLSPREEEVHSTPKCVLPNGAVIAFWEGQVEPEWVRGEAWTHGFFMQPHNDEYWAEHERAAQEQRPPSIPAFADANGTDMCMVRDGEMPVGTPFDDYFDCTISKTASHRFADFLPKDSTLTLVVPWPVPQGTSSSPFQRPAQTGPETELAPRLGRQPYFTRNRAASVDCRSLRVESKNQDLASGFQALDASIAEENMADAQNPGVLDHQCLTVCEGDSLQGAGSCYPGSIVWMAHDLRELTERNSSSSAVSSRARRRRSRWARRRAGKPTTTTCNVHGAECCLTAQSEAYCWGELLCSDGECKAHGSEFH